MMLLLDDILYEIDDAFDRLLLALSPRYRRAREVWRLFLYAGGGEEAHLQRIMHREARDAGRPYSVWYGARG